jgi:thioredoxin-like negative regulator of GroEL
MVQNERERALDFTSYIIERTTNFTGREWVFQAINDWLADPDGARSFLLKGEPGSGKTAISARLSQFSQGLSSPNGLPHLTQGYLSAIHFCSARDTTWIDPLAFAGSLATQLANRYPAYLKILEDLHQEKHIEIDVKQTVQEVINGQMIGVLINVSGPSPESAFNRVVREPLKALLDGGVTDQVVILVDALDEALSYSGPPTIITLLAKTDQLSPRVRFLLTTRQEERVESQFPKVQELSLAISGDQRNQDDIQRYVEVRLQNDLQLVEKAAQVEIAQVTELIETVPRKAVGNFLYVSFLLDAMAKGIWSLTKLEGLPPGLDWLYFDSLRRIVELGKRDWFNEYRPLMGVLSAAQESLTLAQIQAFTDQSESSCIEYRRNLEQFIEEVKPQGEKGEQVAKYRLYHQSVMDFLHSKVISLNEKGVERKLENIFYLPVEEWHKHMAKVCEQGNLSIIWSDIKRDQVEQERREYARRHYIVHLYYAGTWQRLFDVLDEGVYGRAKIDPGYDPSMRLYAFDLDLGRKATSSWQWDVQEAIQLLPRLWRYTLLRYSLVSRVNNYPIEAFNAMLLLDQETKALGLAAFITDPERKAEVIILIANYVAKQQTRKREAEQLFAQAESVIATIFNGHTRVSKLIELAMALMQEHQFQEAERVISSISAEGGRARALIGLGRALAQTHQQPEAERIWHKARHISKSFLNEEGRALTLTELASALAEVQQWQEAKQMWQEAELIIVSLPDEGPVQKRTMALARLAEALAQAQQWQEARRVIASISSDSTREIVSIKLAKALAQAQQWQQAEQIIASLSSKEYQLDALTELAVALAQAQQWQQAEQIIASLSGARDTTLRPKALIGLATALIQAQQWQQAERVWAPLTREGYGAEPLIELAFALSQTHQQQEAERIWHEAERIISSNPYEDQRAVELCKLVMSLAEAQQVREAKRIWQEAEQIITSVSDNEHRVVALIRLATALAQTLQEIEAKQIWREAERLIASPSLEGKRDEAFARLAEALTQTHQWQEAERICRSISSEWVRARALTELAKALIQERQGTEAQQIWQEVKRIMASLSDDRWQAKALTELATALAQEKQPEAEQVWNEAERVSLAISSEVGRDDALSELAKALAQTKQLEEAQRICASISSWVWRDEALATLATILAQDQMWPEAEQIIASLSYDSARTKARSELATALAQAQQWDDAAQIIVSITDPWWRDRSAGQFAIALAQSQQWPEAEQIISSISSSTLQDDAWSGVAITFVQAQQWDDAERIIASISAMEKRVEALTKLAAALIQYNEYERCLHLLYHWWEQVTTKNDWEQHATTSVDALRLFPLACNFIPLYPKIGIDFYQAFNWVDNFLHG